MECQEHRAKGLGLGWGLEWGLGLGLGLGIGARSYKVTLRARVAVYCLVNVSQADVYIYN